MGTDRISDTPEAPKPLSAEEAVGTSQVTASPLHPHEPETPVFTNQDGRCLVCGGMYAVETMAQEIGHLAALRAEHRPTVEDVAGQIIAGIRRNRHEAVNEIREPGAAGWNRGLDRACEVVRAVAAELLNAPARPPIPAARPAEGLDMERLAEAIKAAHLRTFSDMGALADEDGARRIAAEYARLGADRTEEPRE